MVYEVVHREGLWKKTGTYRERPRVTYEGSYLMLLESTNQLVFSSSFPITNSADPSHFSMAQVEYQWVIQSQQGQKFNMDICLPTAGRSFNSLVYFVFFKYHLDYHSFIEAEVALHDSLQITGNTTSLTVIGSMSADQRKPFRWRERYELFDPERRDAEHYKPTEIAARITEQPFNVRLDRKLHLFTYSEADSDQCFHLRLSVLISEDEFTYKTDTWELLKWAAIQYFTAFVIINYFINRFLTSLFESKLIEATPCCK
ncbi:hypothetical protein OESDEN_04212 [Oesophagostomum dentatum]|uniref:Transmembrane protein 231 n=1 Tax=Oesophagostomum dentatum TaxID=61180 RepID=A0A0B1TE49_OESDE|nr:hypothetical protein OESDEN_04212 [Oesophagostomum dentatum]